MPIPFSLLLSVIWKQSLKELNRFLTLILILISLSLSMPSLKCFQRTKSGVYNLKGCCLLLDEVKLIAEDWGKFPGDKNAWISVIWSRRRIKTTSVSEVQQLPSRDFMLRRVLMKVKASPGNVIYIATHLSGQLGDKWSRVACVWLCEIKMWLLLDSSQRRYDVSLFACSRDIYFNKLIFKIIAFTKKFFILSDIEVMKLDDISNWKELS